MAAPLRVEDHLALILDRIDELSPYEQPLLDCLDLSIATSVESPMRLPSFDNSAMDGYAVLHSDLLGASSATPVELPVVGEIAAGQSQAYAMSPGTAVRIMTGAPVPDGCTAVVPVELTDNGLARVRVHEPVAEGAHIRRAGEDVEVGDRLVAEGDRLDPRRLGLLASVGLPRVPVRPRPRVVVMSTGAELAEPGTVLGRDRIYDSNSFLLAAAARTAGAVAYRVPATSDDPESFLEALNDQLVRADIVVTSGGVSKGDYDVVKEALIDLGTVDFHEVAMRPGKPQGFGVVGEDAIPIFTLPGNPVSSYVSFEVFVLPAIRKMMGLFPYSRPMVKARLTRPVGSSNGRRQFLRGRLGNDAETLTVAPAGGPGSHLLGGLAGADALMVIDESVQALPAGAEVPVLRLNEEF